MFIPNLQRIGKGNGQMGLVYIRHGMHTSSPVPFSATSFVLCVTICTCVLYATRKMCNMPHTHFGVVLSAASRSPIFHFENERVFTNSIQNLISIQIALPQLHFHFHIQFNVFLYTGHIHLLSIHIRLAKPNRKPVIKPIASQIEETVACRNQFASFFSFHAKPHLSIGVNKFFIFKQLIRIAERNIKTDIPLKATIIAVLMNLQIQIQIQMQIHIR